MNCIHKLFVYPFIYPTDVINTSYRYCSRHKELYAIEDLSLIRQTVHYSTLRYLLGKVNIYIKETDGKGLLTLIQIASEVLHVCVDKIFKWHF